LFSIAGLVFFVFFTSGASRVLLKNISYEPFAFCVFGVLGLIEFMLLVILVLSAFDDVAVFFFEWPRIGI